MKKKYKPNSRAIHPAKQQVNLDGWTNLLTGLGQCGRDKKEYGFYRINRIFDRGELDQMYVADGLMRLIIDIFAQEMVRQGFVIEGDSDGNVIAKLEELKINSVLTEFIKWARLYGGSIVLMGINDGRPLNEPVDENTLRSVDWLRVFDRYQAYSADGTFDMDLNSPNYGYPNIYMVNDNRTGAVFFAHHSRVMRMDWSVLPPRLQNNNQGWGDPLAQSIYEELRNYSVAFSHTASMMEDFVNAVLKIPNLSLMLASQCDQAPMNARANILNMTKSTMNLMVLDSEETYEKLTTNVSGVSDLIDRFMYALSAVSQVPVSLLFGRSAAGMNSTGDNDVRNFYDAIRQHQESKLRDPLEKLIRYIMISKDGDFYGVEPEKWKLEFVPLWQNTEEQDAITRKIVAETDALYIDRGVLTPEEVAISRFGGNSWSMNTEIDVKAHEEFGQLPFEEGEALEKEKEQSENPAPTEGVDYTGTGLTGVGIRA